MICYVKLAYSVEFDAFWGESKKVATLPAPSGNTPDIEWMQPRSLLFSAKVKENCLFSSYDDDFDKWIDIDDAFVVTC